MIDIVLLGAGGNCKVVLDILRDSFNNYNIVGVTDIDKTKHGRNFYGTRVLGDDEILVSLYKQGITNALVALGSTGNSYVRKKLFKLAKDSGYTMINAISSNSIISRTVKMGEGNIVMDGVIIHSDTQIGDNCIINSGSILEHDCIIGSHVHVAPGVKIAGGVKIGEDTHIGLGANIIQGINIGSNSIVGAGAVIIEDVPDNSLVVGVPAKVKKVLK